MVGFRNIALCISVLLFAGTVQAQLLQDNGTSTDGKLILPKDMAKFCGVSSHSVSSAVEIEACFNKILRLSHQKEKYLKEFSQMFIDMDHDYSSDFYDLAVTTKASAGDVEDQLRKQVDEKVSSQGAKTDESKNISNSQYKNALLAGMASNTLLDLIDVTSSLNMLQDVHHIYYIETSDKAAEISED